MMFGAFGNRDHEDDVHQQKGRVAVRACQHVCCRHVGARGVDDGREMYGDGQGEHGRAQPLGQEEERAHRVLPSIRASVARLRPAIA